MDVIRGLVVSLLSTGLYAAAIYLSYYFVKRIDFKNTFAPPTPLLGLILILILTPFILSPLNFVFNNLFDFLINPGGGLLRSLEGLFLAGMFFYIYKKLAPRQI